MTMRLIIVRHGETAENIGRIIQGHRNNSLSLRGKEQVRRLAHRLKDQQIDVLYSSDLRRAKETAEIISAEINLKIETAIQLRERCCGEFEGQSVVEYEKALAASGLAKEAFIPFGGESLVDLEKRVSAFLSSIFSDQTTKTVLLVAHSGTNRAILKLLLNKDFADWLLLEQDNACINIFEISVDKVKAVLLNCTAHLESMESNTLHQWRF